MTLVFTTPSHVQSHSFLVEPELLYTHAGFRKKMRPGRELSQIVGTFFINQNVCEQSVKMLGRLLNGEPLNPNLLSWEAAANLAEIVRPKSSLPRDERKHSLNLSINYYDPLCNYLLKKFEEALNQPQIDANLLDNMYVRVVLQLDSTLKYKYENKMILRLRQKPELATLFKTIASQRHLTGLLSECSTNELSGFRNFLNSQQIDMDQLSIYFGMFVSLNKSQEFENELITLLNRRQDLASRLGSFANLNGLNRLLSKCDEIAISQLNNF